MLMLIFCAGFGPVFVNKGFFYILNCSNVLLGSYRLWWLEF